jgi:3-oxoacyl-[acyl-carrier protein] reductase
MTAQTQSAPGGLHDHVAIVTGGGQGIGRATAERLAADGAAVAILDKDEASAEAVVAALKNQGWPAVCVRCDISDREQVRAAVHEVVVAFGHVSVLVNNAGIIRLAPFLETSDELFADVLKTNLQGTFAVAREVARIMVDRRYGRIINMSSVSAHISHNWQAAYAVSKAGIEAMTRAMAFELAPFGITVNAIAPGSINTSFGRGLVPDAEVTDRTDRIPMGRAGSAEEVAAAIAFLASMDAGYITGSVVTIDGGLVKAGVR